MEHIFLLVRPYPRKNIPTKSMDFFVWLGLSRGFEQHAASLRNGLRMQAQTRPARARRRHSGLWQRRATTLDEKRRDLIGIFFLGYGLGPYWIRCESSIDFFRTVERSLRRSELARDSTVIREQARSYNILSDCSKNINRRVAQLPE
jgi:hypothetical protein